MQAFSVWSLTRFLRDEGGSATIESVLWLTVSFATLILIMDVSYAFYGRALAFRIVQDGNRAYSVGRYATDSAAQTAIRNALRASISPNATVTTRTSNGVIVTRAELRLSDLLPFDSLPIPSLSTSTTVVLSVHYKES